MNFTILHKSTNQNSVKKLKSKQSKSLNWYIELQIIIFAPN